MHRKVGVFSVAVAAAVALALPVGAAALTKVVYPGGPVAFQNHLGNRYGGGVDDFLVNRATINQGDSVVWDGAARGFGFHTIDLPGNNSSDLTLILANPAHPVTGVKDVAGNPFWFNGLPSLGFNPALFASSGGHFYDGSKRVDTGLPFGPPKPFKVTFTKPGAYKYFCDVHYGMKGIVVVLAKGKQVPSAKQDRAELAREENRDVKIARTVDKTTVPGNNVSVGGSGAHGVEVFAMFPATLHVAAGAVVTFSMSAQTRETHTVTFGDTSKHGYVTNLGKTAFNGPTIDPRGGFPSDPPAGPLSLNLTSHGNGFGNTGPLDRDAGTVRVPPSGQIKFTQAGVYHYICLIHSFMHGTVIVG